MRTRPAAMLPVALALLAACRAVPAARPVPAPCPAGMAMIREELYFGRGLADGGEVSDSAWQVFLRDELTPRFPDGVTILDARGQWRGPSGLLVQERSWVVVLYHEPGALAALAVEELVRVYVTRFAQDAVLRDRAPACVTFQVP
ncbi:MAG: DUF3574 domain-containing protein [Gemmatimonadetes bacterium]|nr:DUF3574 domain-containing protein [Gemmatimonadota bacterium]MBK9691148.1 DUF3574 domain-containing protein [Gemmatimonadota bacterium]